MLQRLSLPVYRLRQTVFPMVASLLAKFDVGEIAIHKSFAFGTECFVARLNVVAVRGVNVIASDYEVYGATERIGYLPSGGQWDAAIGAITGAFVAGVG